MWDPSRTTLLHDSFRQYRGGGSTGKVSRSTLCVKDCDLVLRSREQARLGGRAMTKRAKKRNPKTILKLSDLEHSKNAVLNSLSSMSSRRSYDHAIRDAIDWYCSEPRLAFNRTVVTRYRIAWNSAGLHRRRSISGLRGTPTGIRGL